MDALSAAPIINPNALTGETVLSVDHYTDSLFSFRLSRPPSFRFRAGEFVMIGLPVNGKPLLRAYSIASRSWDETLEFYSIKVPDGPLTSRLQLIKPGENVILGRKPTGTLVLDTLTGGDNLYLLATGTGIAPFASTIREPETYERFKRVFLIHGCRSVAEFQYGERLIASLKDDPLVGESATSQLTYYTTATREPHPHTGRIPDLLQNCKLYRDLGVEPLNPKSDRVMICGSRAMLNDLKAACEKAGLTEGSNAEPGEFVVEKSFVG